MPSIRTEEYYPVARIIPGQEAAYRKDLREVVQKAVQDNGGTVDLSYLEAPVVPMVGTGLMRLWAEDTTPNRDAFNEAWDDQNSPHLRVMMLYTPSDDLPDDKDFVTKVAKAIKEFLDNCGHFIDDTVTDVWIEPLNGAAYVG